MCPSYQVTREEKDCTRGRAHLLLEMMNGEVLTDGWKSEAVKDSLDLCLACKGCKGECPVNVDMATYKAEFLSHYYEGRLRPRYAYAMGLDRLVVAAGVAVPRTWPTSSARRPAWRHLPSSSAASPTQRHDAAVRRADLQGVVRASGRCATRTNRRSFCGRTRSTTTSTPELRQAAVEVLEHAGYQVWVPRGRPVLRPAAVRLRHARHGQEVLLRKILKTLQPQIEAGIPIVGLEPSCVSVFRDELTGLFPNNKDAKRLHDHTFLLSEFLNKKVKDYRLPQLHRKAVRARPLPSQGDCRDA